MSIICRCPHCQNLCAFKDEHVGRRATCGKCQNKFIVPEQNQTPEKVAADAGKPVEGFYTSVFIYNWNVFLRPENAPSLVFLIAMVFFQYFAGWSDTSFSLPGFAVNLPVGWITMILTWGSLFWYYIETVHQMTVGEESLPELDLGSGFSFIWTVIRSIYFFMVSLVLAELPFVLAGTLMEQAGLTFPGMHIALSLAGLYLFPMVLLTLSSADNFLWVFRIDALVIPIVRAPAAYTLTSLMACSAVIGLYGMMLWGMSLKDNGEVPWYYLFVSVTLQVYMIFAMRTVGLFYRHYRCWFKW